MKHKTDNSRFYLQLFVTTVDFSFLQLSLGIADKSLSDGYLWRVHVF